jgi:N-acetylmuramoyl-L-alanine amidase
MRSRRISKLGLTVLLSVALLVATLYGLGLYVQARQTRSAPPSQSSLAARDESSESQFWRRYATAATPAAPTVTAGQSPATATPTGSPFVPAAGGATTDSLSADFASAAREFGVPEPLLESICYMEGRLSNNDGEPSIDNGFGCMHLVQNANFDTLDQAAKDLGVTPALLKGDMATNIRGGAAVLRDDARQDSATHTVPSSLADWYGALTIYSCTTSASVAQMYANAVYQLLNVGFTGTADGGETITLSPQQVQPHVTSASITQPHTTYPSGCTAPDANTDYPGAVDCILNPNVFDCEIVAPGTSTNPCTYDQAGRPSDYAINFVAIHDIEGTVQSALTTFQTVTSGVSIHYIVGADGTVYQVLHEKDVAWHVGNYWYNQHAVGIEHEGYDATGYQWYNATEYLASAKLVAYLLKKYNIPLDRYHVIAHGTVPSPTTSVMPNHVDPGPYWLWSYYFDLIHQQGVPYPAGQPTVNAFTLYPSGQPSSQAYNVSTSSAPVANFFYLHTGPSTTSPLIPVASTTDVTDETGNVEDGLVYYYVAKQPDQAGTGATMYEIWYGEADNLWSSQFMNAHLAWIAAPRGMVMESQSNLNTTPWVPAGTLVQLQVTSGNPAIYGKPVTDATYVVGDAPNNTVFVSGYTAIEYGSTNQWYEIDYNHRQAWVPATEVTVLPSGSGVTVHP